MTSINDKILEILSKLKKVKDNTTSAPIDETEILSTSQSLLQEVNVPEYKHNEDIPYDDAYYAGVADTSQIYLHNYLRLLDEIYNIKCTNTEILSVSFIRSLTQTTLYTVGQYHNKDQAWTNEECSCLSECIINKIVTICNCNCIEELFVGDISGSQSRNKCSLYFENGVLTSILQRLSETFTKDVWKKYPGLLSLYYWILTRLKNPYLTEYLGYLLPPTLFILDDWEEKHKVLGLNAVTYIISNSAHSELRWYGRALVIHDAVRNTLYTREASILQYAYPTIIEAASVIESDPAHSNKLSASHYDKIVQQLTSEMVHEQTLSLRSLYIQFLGKLISKMGIMAVRWSDVILEICDNYASTYEGRQGQDRLQTLKVLGMYIEECWPRVHNHADRILKIIIRLLYDITLDNDALDTDAIHQLESECENIVRLLAAACPETTKKLLQGVDQVDIHDKGQECMSRICEIANQSI